MNYLIGVDLGTSGTKTVIFDSNGTPLASKTIEYPLYQPKNGWAEQDPADWWHAACASMKEVVKKSGVKPSDIKGIGISGQMHGLVMLDKSGEVLRKSIIGVTREPQRNVRKSLRKSERSVSSRLRRIPRSPDLQQVKSCGSRTTSLRFMRNARTFFFLKITYATCSQANLRPR